MRGHSLPAGAAGLGWCPIVGAATTSAGTVSAVLGADDEAVPASVAIGTDRTVRRIGYGAMRLSTAAADRAASIEVLRTAVESGVQLIDTAFLYGWGANEELVAAALHPYPEDVLIATKIGIDRAGDPGAGARPGPPGPGEYVVHGHPDALRRQTEAALRRLRVDRIDLLQLHVVDPGVPLADQVGALDQLRDAGKAAAIGLSNITVDQLDEAVRMGQIATVQNRFHVLDREHDAVLDRCPELGIAFLPWRPTGAGDVLASAEIAGLAREVSRSTGATVTAPQIALAWLLHRRPVTVPIPGTADVGHLHANVAASGISLSADDLRMLDALGAADTG